MQSISYYCCWIMKIWCHFASIEALRCLQWCCSASQADDGRSSGLLSHPTSASNTSNSLASSSHTFLGMQWQNKKKPDLFLDTKIIKKNENEGEKVRLDVGWSSDSDRMILKASPDSHARPKRQQKTQKGNTQYLHTAIQNTTMFVVQTHSAKTN